MCACACWAPWAPLIYSRSSRDRLKSLWQGSLWLKFKLSEILTLQIPQALRSCKHLLSRRCCVLICILRAAMLPSREWRTWPHSGATPRQQRAAQKQHSQEDMPEDAMTRAPSAPRRLHPWLPWYEGRARSRPPQDGAPLPPPAPPCPLCRQHVVPGSPSQPRPALRASPYPWRHGRILDPEERSLASGAGGLCGTRETNIIYFVPLTWPLNGMEFDIGGGVDNGVTTSGKEVQEALVNVRLHRWAGSVREASRVTASLGRRRPSSGARGRSLTDTPDGAVLEQPRHTHPGLESPLSHLLCHSHSTPSIRFAGRRSLAAFRGRPFYRLHSSL